jgi:hemerythrin
MSAEMEGKRAPFVVEWREAFKTFIPKVDDEHKYLFLLVKALDLQSIETTVNELLNYVIEHFGNEQALMEQSGYPDFKEHLKLHESFAMTVGEFLGSGDAWSEERVQELRRFLNKWLIGHIMTHDMRFGRWYVERRSQRAQVLPGPPVQASPESRGWLSRLFGRK